MDTSIFLRCGFLIALAGLIAGCQSIERGSAQSISIYSFPAGADVTHDGEVIGQTPTEIALARKLTHQITLGKNGYQSAVVSIVPQRNRAGEHMVQFGLAEQAGIYYDLQPNPVQVRLTPAILPAFPGANRFEEMSALIVQVDAMHEDGQIDPVEHKYQINRIIEFYYQ